MPRRKSFQTLIIESILFVSLFALVGHLSLNFWERYVVQTELSKMKTSLHSLKETINHIGFAYNQLYKELQGLADMAEGGKTKINSIQIKYDKIDKPTTQHTYLAQELLEDIHIKAVIDGGIAVKDSPKIKTEKTQTVENKVTQIALNATSKESSQLNNSKKDKIVGDNGYRNKKLQNNMPIHKDMKNTGTVTRNPPKSTAAGTDKIAKILDATATRKHEENNPKRANIHKCHDDNYYCPFTESPNCDLARF